MSLSPEQDKLFEEWWLGKFSNKQVGGVPQAVTARSAWTACLVSNKVEELQRRVEELESEQFEYCDDCGAPLSACGEPSPDGTPSMDCKVCQLRDKIDDLERQLEGIRKEREEWRDCLNNRMDRITLLEHQLLKMRTPTSEENEMLNDGTLSELEKLSKGQPQQVPDSEGRWYRRIPVEVYRGNEMLFWVHKRRISQVTDDGQWGGPCERNGCEA